MLFRSGLAIVERQVQQDQVAQAFFLGALTGHASVAQGDYCVTYAQQALAVALNDLDVVFAQPRDQRVGNAEVAFDNTAVNGLRTADGGRLRTLGSFGIAIKALAALALPARGGPQIFLDQRGCGTR